MSGPTIEQLRQSVRGAVITAEDEGYEEARRVHNAMIDKRPSVVVRPANAGDVIAAVDFARENELDLAVRGRRPQRARLRHLRRRRGRRPVGDAGRTGGPAKADGAGRGRRHLGRLQRRDARLRAGHDRRHHLHHRRRRTHPRRWDRVPRARPRSVLRQPDLGRRGDRGRSVSSSPARRRTRTCSGRSAAAAATSVW